MFLRHYAAFASGWPRVLAGRCAQALGRAVLLPGRLHRGCTVEAHDFAKATDGYKALGAAVVGVSGDIIATLDRFSVSACQSRFAVAADPDRAIMKAYDAVLIPFTPYAERTSYVITPDGKVIYRYTALDPDDHVANTLKAFTTWRATNGR